MKGVYLKKGNTRVSVVPYYRVGDLFLTTIATNPSNFLGGKWELFGPGRCLVCVDTSDSAFNSVKKTGGEKTHKLTVNEMPKHRHNTRYGTTGSSSQYGSAFVYTGYDGNNNVMMMDTGGDQAHNNLQPYITCYVWIRTA